VSNGEMLAAPVERRPNKISPQHTQRVIALRTQYSHTDPSHTL
jgi:hypothetical protein